MASYLLKAPDADFDRWRLAQRDSEYASLASWLRAAAEAFEVATPGVAVRAVRAFASDPGGDDQFSELLRREAGYPPRTRSDDPARPFKPDFGSRLKKEGKK